jgi:predicted chitinase
MGTPFPTLRLRDGFTGQNEHLRPSIEEFQQLVNDISEFGLEVDGWYGNDSDVASRTLQRRYGFYDDGTVRSALVRWLRHLKDHPEDRIEPPDGVTLIQLIKIVGERNEAHARRHLDGLNEAMRRYRITTSLRRAHFLSQVAHESGGLRWDEELASGAAYEGRGLIQLTGRSNYRQYTEHRSDLGDNSIDFEQTPEIVSDPPYAADVAGWYWDSRSINAKADDDDINAVTRKINGGLNGLDDRKRYLRLAKNALEA